MKKRTLGKTGEKLTIVGFGGILVSKETRAEANRLVAEAVEKRGLNYFDVAPSYGNAEEMLGPALEPYRKNVFLACKTGKRDAKGAEEELQTSLKRLRTDHFDVYQLHGVRAMEEVEQIFAPGGAMETFLKAKERGLTRFLGFSAHSEEAALALMDRFAFDTILFPFNWVCWLKNNFGPAVLAKAKSKGMGIFALKAMAKHKWESETRAWPKCWYHPADTAEEAALGLRFTLSQGVNAAVTPGHEHLFNWACDAAEHYKPITPAEEAELARRAQTLEAIFPQ